MVSSAASRTLKSSYRRILLKEDKGIDSHFVTEQIRIEIRKRQKLNRAKRNCSEIMGQHQQTIRSKIGRNERIQLLYDINEQPLKISEMDVEIEQYWDSKYENKHNRYME